MAKPIRCRWRERPHKALNRHAAGPLMPLSERLTHTLQCLGCRKQIGVTLSKYQQAIRLGLPHTICDDCEKRLQAVGNGAHEEMCKTR